MHLIHKDLGAIDKSDFLTQYFYVLKEPKPNILGSSHELSIRHCEFDNLLDPIYLGSGHCMSDKLSNSIYLGSTISLMNYQTYLP